MLSVDKDNDVKELDDAQVIENMKKKWNIAMGRLEKKCWMLIQICTYMHSVGTCVNACIEYKKTMLLVKLFHIISYRQRFQMQ